MQTARTASHPVTDNASSALLATVTRGIGATNFWVQYRDGSQWITEQFGTNRRDAALRYGEISEDGHMVLFGADHAMAIIMCTSPEYESWARP